MEEINCHYVSRNLGQKSSLLPQNRRFNLNECPLTDEHALSIDNGKVIFRYQNSRNLQWKIMTLDAMEFIRRFLQHVLPRGIHKVRYYGLWNPSNRNCLRSLQVVLTQETPGQSSCIAELIIETVSAVPMQNGKICPSCGKGILLCRGIIHRRKKVPP